MGGEEVVGEVLAQLAGRCAAVLALFTPAQKTGGRFFLFHHQYLVYESCLLCVPEIPPNDNVSCSCAMPGLIHTNGCFFFCKTAGESSTFVVLYSNEEKCFWSFVAPQASPMWAGNVADGCVRLTAATRQTASVASG